MRRILVFALAAALGACGSSGSDTPPAPASGTIMGSPFTPVDRGALVTPAETCTLTGLGTRSMTVLAMGFSSYANVCGFVQTAQLCGEVASSRVVTVSIVNAPAAGAAAPVGPGTYTIGMHVNPSNDVLAVGADVTSVDAACAPAGAIPDALSGTIVVASVSPRVAGTLDVTFTDGSRFAGSFDLEVCVAAVSFCTVMNGTCASYACCSNATTCA